MVTPSVPGLAIGASFSVLDSEITDKLIPTNDVRVGDSLAFAPDLQFNANARYDWTLRMVGVRMPCITSRTRTNHSDIIIINHDRVQGWTMMGVRQVYLPTIGMRPSTLTT